MAVESMTDYEKKVRATRNRMLAAEKRCARALTSRRYLDSARAGKSIPISIASTYQRWEQSMKDYHRTVAQTLLV